MRSSLLRVMSRLVLAAGMVVALTPFTSGVANAADDLITLNSVGAATAGTGIRVKYQSGQFQVMRAGQNQLFKPDIQNPPASTLYNGIAMSLTTSPTSTTGRAVYPRLFNLGSANSGTSMIEDTFDSYDTYLVDPVTGNRISGTSTPDSGSLVSEMSFTDPATSLSYKVTLRVDYVYPDEWMKQTFTVSIPAGNTKTIRLFNVYDTYLGSSDSGPGYYQAASTSAVEMVYTSKTGVFEGLARLSGPQWAGYASENYKNVVFSQSQVGTTRYGPGFGANLTKIIDPNSATDNGIGINWDFGTNGTAGSTSAPASAVTTEPAVGLFTFAMPPAPPTISTASVGPAVTGTPFTQSLAGTVNYGSTQTWALAPGSSLPPGLTLAPDGTISGTPTAGGSYTYTVTLTDSLGTQNTKTYTTTIPSGPTITTSSLPAGTTGSVYSQTVAATGGTGALTFSLDSGSLPAGLSMSSSGAITGTPTTPGSSTFTVKVTDANLETSTKQFTIVVADPVDITTTSLTGGTTGVSYSQTVASTGGTGPYTYAVTSGSLPAGLTMTSSGLISGTPTGSGTSNFSVTVTDADGRTDTQALSIAVTTPKITYNPNGASGSLADVTAAAGAMVTFAGSSGLTPPQIGGVTPQFLGWSTDPNASSPTYTAGQQISMPETGLQLFAVWDPPVVASITYDGNGALGSTSPTTGTVGSNVTIAANGFTAPPGATFLGWSTNPNASTPDPAYDPGDSVIMPAGGTPLYAVWSPAVSVITYSANGGTGSIPNSPAANGSSVTVSTSSGLTAPTGKVFLGWSTNPNASTPDPAYDPGDSVTMPAGGVNLHAVWGPPPSITTASLPDGTTGSAYSQTVAATGGAGPYSFAVTNGSLPAGLTMSSSGAITGTPTTPGSSTFSVTVTDAGGRTDTQALSITVNAGTTSSITYAPNGGSGSVSATTAADGAMVNLASGSALTPPSAGETFLGWDRDPSASTPTYSAGQQIVMPSGGLALHAIWGMAPPSITTTSLSDGTTGSAYSQTVAATGGAGPYSFAVTSGSLPAGLTMAADGSITGTPTTPGSSTFSVTVTDTNGLTDVRQFTVTIVAAASPASVPTISFDTNGASGSIPSVTAEAGAAVTLPSGSGLVPPLVNGTIPTLLGWSQDPNASTPQYVLSQVISMPATDLTLFAVWSPPINASIILNGNGGSGSMPPISGAVGSTVFVPANSFIGPDGRPLLGWATSPAGKVVFKEGDVITLPQGGMTLYAVWGKIPQTSTKQLPMPSSLVLDKKRLVVGTNVMTNAGQKARTRVVCIPLKRSFAPRGDIAVCDITRKKNSKIIVSVQRPPVKVRVVLTAPPTEIYTAYRHVKTYVLR